MGLRYGLEGLIRPWRAYIAPYGALYGPYKVMTKGGYAKEGNKVFLARPVYAPELELWQRLPDEWLK